MPFYFSPNVCRFDKDHSIHKAGKSRIAWNEKQKKYYMSFLNTWYITKFEAFRLEHFVEHKPLNLWRMKDKIMEGMSPGHTGRNDIKSYHLRRPNAVLLLDQLGQFLLAIMHLVIFLMWKMQWGFSILVKLRYIDTRHLNKKTDFFGSNFGP